MQLFEEIDKLYITYINILKDLCNIESPTNYKEGVDKVLNYCISLAEAEGYKTDIYHHDISGNTALITMNPEAKGNPIVLSAHMDTVHPVGSFGYPAVIIDDENMYGPGTTDCKGGIVVAFLAMKALKEVGFCSRPVKLYLQSDEENNSMTSNKKTIEQMCSIAKDADGFINLEGSVKDSAVLTRKGILRFKFTVHGKATHSAKCNYGANAVCEAAYKIIELEKMKNPDGLTCNCVISNGGDAPNTVPELCTFTADIRFINNEELETARAIVNDIANKCFVEGCSTVAEEVSLRPAMVRSEKKQFVSRKNE